MDVKKAAAETKDYIVSIRREFHRHPELSLQEFRTAQRIEEELDKFGIPYEVHVMSAHRTPALAAEFASNAKKNGFGVILSAAGKAAHLGGVLAAHTTLPVVGIPVKSSTLDGLDALLATVQMPKGIPVATVAIDGAANAAILAAQMLALSDPEIDAKLEQIMINIFHNLDDAAKKYGKAGNYVVGANIAGFEKVVDAMNAQGIV